MAQENANILHAALHVAPVGAAPGTPAVVASTGIDLESLGHPFPGRFEFSLVDGIADSELSITFSIGNVGGGSVLVWNRDLTDPTLRRFNVQILVGGGPSDFADFCIEFHRIAQAIEPIPFPPSPP